MRSNAAPTWSEPPQPGRAAAPGRDKITSKKQIEPAEQIAAGARWDRPHARRGPMRTCSLGALLLNRDDPTTVLGRTATPILHPLDKRRDGSTPNAVYSCGGLIKDNLILIPIGIGDARIGVFSIEVGGLLARLVP